MAKSKKKKYNKKKKNPNRVPQSGAVKKSSGGGAAKSGSTGQSAVSKPDAVRQRQMWIALAVAVGVFLLLLLIARLSNRNNEAATPDAESAVSGEAVNAVSGDAESVTSGEAANAVSGDSASDTGATPTQSGDAAASEQAPASTQSGDGGASDTQSGGAAAQSTATDNGASATTATATDNASSAAADNGASSATDSGSSAPQSAASGDASTDSASSETTTTSTDNNASAATTTATDNGASDAAATQTASLQSADADDVDATEYADIVVKDYGAITVALDGATAPITVQNFVSLAKSGFYDGLTFHRIMDGFMIQGGDPKGDGTGGAENNIVGEFQSNGIVNNISHTRGTISMARASGDENSASSQFFIVQTDSAFLDGDYAAFGHVTSGMEVVDKICKDAKPIDNNGTIKPEEQPIIESITIRDN